MIITALKDATDKVRVAIIKNKVIKPIKKDKYILNLELELLPLFMGALAGIKQEIIKIDNSIKESATDDIVDDYFDDDFRRKLGEAIATNKDKVVVASILNAAKEAGYFYGVEKIEKNILAGINERVFKITTTEITENISNQLKDKLNKAYSEGWSTKKISKSLDMLETNYSTIARTEINGAIQEGNYRVLEELNRETPAKMEKRWVTSGLPNTRDSHLEAEAMGWIPFDMPFNNGLMFPLDPAGSAGEVINCLCDLQTRVIGVEE